MKLALVHDFLTQEGGAERVLKAVHEIWPEAPIFVLFYDRDKVPYFKQTDVRESFLAKIPFAKRHYRGLLPFMPLATEGYDLREFDVVLSSSSAFAKGVLTRPGTMHMSYCHTPTRYLWTDTEQYISDLDCNPLLKAILPSIIHRMRLWDKMSVDRVDYFVANSDTVRHRIKKYYRRDSDIIHPPVDTHLFSSAEAVGDYFVTGGRLVPYKRMDLVVQVFNRLRWPLKIFGVGPALSALRSMAKSNIEFLGRITDESKADLLSRAKAFIHPQVEDFGITPVESMAAGRPVIAFPVGGITETVISGQTGVFFTEQTWESLLDTVLHFDANQWSSEKIRTHAQKFSTDEFKKKIRRHLESTLAEFERERDQCKIPI